MAIPINALPPNVAADNIFFSKNVKAVVRVVDVLKPKDYFASLFVKASPNFSSGNDPTIGPAKGTSTIGGIVGEKTVLISLDKGTMSSMTGAPVFDGTERSQQITLPDGVELFSKKPTTAIVVTHQKYTLVIFMQDDNPKMAKVKLYKTGGDNAMVGKETGRFALGEQFNPYLSIPSQHAASGVFSTEKHGSFLYIIPHMKNGFAIKLGDDVEKDQKLEFKEDGAFSLTGSGAKISGNYIKKAESVDKVFCDSASAKENGNRTVEDNIGVVPGSQSVVVDKGGVMEFDSEGMAKYFGTDKFEGSEIIEKVANTGDAVLYAIFTRKGPTIIEVPKTGGTAKVYDMNGIAGETTYQKNREGEFAFQPIYAKNENMFAWISVHGDKKYRLNVLFPRGKEKISFDIENPGPLAIEGYQIAVDGKQLFQALPAAGEVKQTITIMGKSTGYNAPKLGAPDESLRVRETSLTLVSPAREIECESRRLAVRQQEKNSRNAAQNPHYDYNRNFARRHI